MMRGAGFSATAGRRCRAVRRRRPEVWWWMVALAGFGSRPSRRPGGGDAEGYTVCSYSKFVHLDCKAITKHLRAMLLLADEEIHLP